MQDAATRDEIRASTNKSMLVEAAAGTGKTTLIVDRVLQGVRDGTLHLPSTVAITFTEKAAGELESRLRTKLAEELHGADVSDRERARLLTAVEELDRAHISTIHSFCAAILREKPAECGVDPEFGVMDATQAELLIERCWREWMDLQVAQCPEPLVEALRAGASVEDLRQIARALAAGPEILEDPRFALTAPDENRDKLTASLCEAAARAVGVFERAMTGRGNENSRALRDSAKDIVAAGPDDASTVRRLAYGAAAARLDRVMSSFRKEARQQARGVLEEFVQTAGRLGNGLAWDVFGWLRGFVDYYREAKLARSVLDFQDLLLLTARVLRQNVGVRRYFQQRFDAFFVDEFQDTDPLQAELIAYLCERRSGRPAGRMEDVRLEDGKLVAVADPKQSIYRFRRADVEIYELFKDLFGAEAFGEDRVRLLSSNFRSTQPLLDWFNRLFECVFSLPAEGGARQARHVPLAPGLEKPRPPGPSVVAVCPPARLDAQEWDAGRARRYEAQFLASMLHDVVEGGPGLPGWQGRLRYGDFAFLFRALTDVDIYEDALDKYGIPYRVIGGKHFYQREQIVETLAVLRAVDDPLDEPAVVGALRSSFFGVSDEELFRYRESGGLWNYLRTEVDSGPVGEAMSLLARWHRRRNRVPPQVLLREVLDTTKAPQAFQLKPAGAQRAANLEKMLNQLRSLGSAAGTFGAVVRHLSTVQQTQLPEEESSLVEPGDDFVQVLSMHKAKGLEFDAVVLPDLFRRFPIASSGSRLLFNRIDGRVGLKVATGIQSEHYDDLAVEEHGNQLAELNRLLYVACTRARRLLILPLFWKQTRTGDCFQKLMAESGCFAPPDEVPYGQERDGVYYLDTDGLADSVDVTARPSRLPEEGAEDVEALVRERELWLESHRRLIARASSTEPFVLPSSLEAELEPDRLGEEAAGGRGGRGLPRAGSRGLGSLFHNVMRAVPLEGRAHGDIRRLARNLARMEADALGLDGQAAEQAAELALAALENPQFLSLLQGAEAIEKEVSFSVPLGSLSVCPDDAPGLVEGSIDLLLRAPGRTTVLDYKTDRLAPRGRERLEEHYWPQLALYALAAQACGCAPGEAELALFFVRAGTISRRWLDPELLNRVAELLAQGVDGAGG